MLTSKQVNKQIVNIWCKNSEILAILQPSQHFFATTDNLIKLNAL